MSSFFTITSETGVKIAFEASANDVAPVLLTISSGGNVDLTATLPSSSISFLLEASQRAIKEGVLNTPQPPDAKVQTWGSMVDGDGISFVFTDFFSGGDGIWIVSTITGPPQELSPFIYTQKFNITIPAILPSNVSPSGTSFPITDEFIAKLTSLVAELHQPA